MRRAMLRGDQPGEDFDTAAADDEIMITFAKCLPAYFADLQSSADVAVFPPLPVDADDAVSQAVQL